MNNVVVRALSGAVYVGAIVAAILLGKIAFCLLTVIFAVIGIYEYYLMAHEPYGDKAQYQYALAVDMIGAIAITVTGAFCLSNLTFFIVLGAYMLLRAVLGLTDKGAHAFREVAKSVFGVMYISVPMLMLNLLYGLTAESNSIIVLLMFVMIWLNDTGAFCFGITLGKRRLCERLSPKKSWEGFWGGMGCCVAFGLACFYWFNAIGLSLWQWLLLGALISLFATWGDLFESMLKRTVKVKDSGTLIPGHGGILDRIDSLLFVGPATAIFIFLVLGY